MRDGTRPTLPLNLIRIRMGTRLYFKLKLLHFVCSYIAKKMDATKLSSVCVCVCVYLIQICNKFTRLVNAPSNNVHIQEHKNF